MHIVKCAAGSKGPGGVCDCSNLKGWAKGKWRSPICRNGRCTSSQIYDGCVGKKNGKMLGDGTWCFNDKRWANCLTIPGKRIQPVNVVNIF